MGLIPQTKCGRCDRTYSSLRSRCPYCGAHRHKKGKRTTDTDNATWKIIIGILLIVVLIAAVIVILVTCANDTDPNDTAGGDSYNNSTDGVVGRPGDSAGGSTDSIGGGPDDSSGSPDDSTGGGTDSTGGDSSDVPVPVIATSITVRKGNSRAEATDFVLYVGDTYNVTAVVTPSNATSIPTWSCDKADAMTVIPDETGMKATLTVTGTGTVNVTVTVDNLDYTFVVRCRKK